MVGFCGDSARMSRACAWRWRALDSADAQPLSPRNANYTIDVTLDTRARTLSARETLVWTNITSAATGELQFHLYYNAWRNARFHMDARAQADVVVAVRRDRGATRTLPLSTSRACRLTGGALAPVDLTKQMRFIAPDDGNEDDRTVMAVDAAGAGRARTRRSRWTSRSRRRSRARSRAPASIGNYYFIAQWFPKIGVLDATGKWNCHQFHVGTEFFADFGVYDVRMTVPRGWPLAATGRERERARTTRTARRPIATIQEDVHDFAWTTSPDFVEARERFEHPGLPPVDMRLLLQPEHAVAGRTPFRERARDAEALRRMVRRLSVRPHHDRRPCRGRAQTDGMEYPTLFTVGTQWLMPREDTYLEDTVGPRDRPSMVVRHGRHQRVRRRLDGRRHQPVRERARHGRGVSRRPRGAALLRRVRAVGARGRAVGPRDRSGEFMPDYRSSPTVDIQATPSFRYWPRTSGPMTYAKPALWLHTLERALGWTTMQQILATFFERWKFKHPRPGDLFQVANEVSGRDLTPFFDQVYRGSAVFDYGVDSVTSAETRRRDVRQRDRRAAAWRRNLPGHHSRDARQRRAAALCVGRRRPLAPRDARAREPRRVGAGRSRPDSAARHELHEQQLHDRARRAARAATKWAATWMVWLQDQLLTWAFFV